MKKKKKKKKRVSLKKKRRIHGATSPPRGFVFIFSTGKKKLFVLSATFLLFNSSLPSPFFLCLLLFMAHRRKHALAHQRDVIVPLRRARRRQAPPLAKKIRRSFPKRQFGRPPFRERPHRSAAPSAFSRRCRRPAGARGAGRPFLRCVRGRPRPAPAPRALAGRKRAPLLFWGIQTFCEVPAEVA